MLLAAQAQAEESSQTMWWKSLLAAGSAFALGSMAALYAAGPPLGSGVVEGLQISSTAAPLNASDTAMDRVGKLRSMGGLVLDSKDRRFGGISAMLWAESCGRLLAVSDTGLWIILEPEEADGQLLGVRVAWIAPLLGLDGRPPASKSAADAESLAQAANGDIWVFYEQQHRGMRFEGVDACRPETLASVPVEQWEPPGTAMWPSNGGIEASAMQGETLLMLSEAVAGPQGGRAGLAGAPGSPVRVFSYMNPDGHQPTAMEPRDPGSDNGAMLVLHRSFSPLRGVSIILSEAQIGASPADVVEPREIARLQPPFLVDNMEALAVRVEGERRYVYLMSDNNFNPLQRTLLMKFELLQEKRERLEAGSAP